MNRDLLHRIQQLLNQWHLKGWLVYGFHDLNPIAKRLAPLPEGVMLSRRWAFWIPARGEPAWLVHAIERGQFAGYKARFVTYSSWQSFEQGLLTLTDGPGSIACEYSPDCGIPYVSWVDAGTADQLRRLGYELHSSADLIQATYAVWTPAQLESHRRAVAICMEAKDRAFEAIREGLRTGAQLTELDIQRIILDHFRARGLDPHHPPIVAVNEHAGDPHYMPTPERASVIQPGDVILIDLWGKLKDVPDAVFADITWMAYAGEQPPAAMQKVFDTVARARDAALALVDARLRAGEPVHGWEVDDAAREVIRAAGYGDAFIHRTGHSLDTDIHGSGVNIDNLETRDTRRIIPGIGFTIEPGIYLPEFGVRLEIDVYVHEDRAEITTLPLQDEFVRLG
ncbi:MAG TPA: aminopeptidase P family protein [Anaerolineae bacterium]|nr:aminopeptidase P family protein [Anaerolineae bacterium]